jgi:recombinational DNA repair protein RecT
MACDRPSLWTACMRAAQSGLLPDGVEGAIVPYGTKATWIPMYQGLLKQFRNSGEFKWIAAGIVYEGEQYHHFIDENGEHFYHQPEHGEGKIRRIYALATTKDGGKFICDMSPAEVAKRANMSRAKRDDAPWKTWPEEMMKKTALRQLAKYLPKSSDVERMLREDDETSVESVEERRQVTAPVMDAKATLDAFGAASSDQSGESESQPPEGGGAVVATDASVEKSAAQHPDRLADPPSKKK